MPFTDYAPVITGGFTLTCACPGGWITYKIQNRTAAQNATQHELAADQREQALFDKRAAAYTDLISLLLRESSCTTKIATDEVNVLALREELTPWPHGAYSSPRTNPRLRYARSDPLRVVGLATP